MLISGMRNETEMTLGGLFTCSRSSVTITGNKTPDEYAWLASQ